jgi:uncharacterized protein
LDVDATRHDAVTPVQSAAGEGRTEAVHILLEHGASATALNDFGDNVLRIAVKTGHTDLVQQLLSRRSSSGQPAVDVNAASGDGGTALHAAVCTQRIDAAALLLQHGAAVNAADNSGITPLYFAALCSTAEIVQLLLDAGADLTASAAVLHAGAFNSLGPKGLQLPLKHSDAGAVLENLVDKCGCCGPRTALTCGSPAAVKLLLAAGADVHVTTDRGNTALHVAAVHKYPASVLCLLIKAGADLHAVNGDGKTAAQVAADNGNTLAAALLVRAARDT